MVLLVPLGPLGALSALKSEMSAERGFMSLGETEMSVCTKTSQTSKSLGRRDVDCFCPGHYPLKSLFFSLTADLRVSLLLQAAGHVPFQRDPGCSVIMLHFI